jgi:hypothetical protein
VLALVPLRIEKADALTASDAYVECAHVYQLLREHELGLQAASASYALAKDVGDLRATARACAWEARFLAAAERFEEAASRLAEGEEAAEQLKHVLLRTEIEASRGYVANRKKDWEIAQKHLAIACRAFQKLQWIARVGETLIAYLAAAHYAGRGDEVALAQKDLETILPAVPGLEIDYRLWFAAAYLDAEQFENAREALKYIRFLAEQREDNRRLEIVQTLEAHLASKDGQAT